MNTYAHTNTYIHTNLTNKSNQSMLTYDILTVNSKKSNADLNTACLNNLAIIMLLNSVINSHHGISLAACPQPPSV